MLFNSLSYLVFFPAVFLLYWWAPQKFRVPLLIVASYLFYMSWKPIYGLLLFGLTAFNFIIGRKLSKVVARNLPTRSRNLLVLGVAVNLLVLGYFKYALFSCDILGKMTAVFGLNLTPAALNIVLPLGISFFVFEFIHYLADVYKGGEPIRSFAKFNLFASFFPTQIAGPIKRYEDFAPQIDQPKRFDLATFDEGVALITHGLFKKVILADTLSIVSQTVFPHPEYLTNFDCWLGVYAFAFQIYYDFSGYTDIARGSAQLLGYKIPINFNAPYMAQSVTDFWHRWHISLSTWLRDYLFIPMGGSRGGLTATCRNLLVTMILGGLWHGAAWHFVIWGAYQGVLLLAHRIWCLVAAKSESLMQIRSSVIYKIIATVCSFHLVCLGWVLFRSEDMRLANLVLRKVLFLEALDRQTSYFALSLPTLHSHIIFQFIVPVLIAMPVLHYLISKPKWTENLLPSMKRQPIFGAVYLAVLICLLLVFSPETTPKFIYFQF
ncbi:MAG TPA: MBOAT family O-acyltransferase [Oculatellaceae cyanobacterium]